MTQRQAFFFICDMRILAESTARRWERNRCPWDVWSDAQRRSDLAALNRVIAWTLDQAPTEAGRTMADERGYKAATRLRKCLSPLTPEQQAEVELHLRLSEQVVVRTLKQLPSGAWARVPGVFEYPYVELRA